MQIGPAEAAALPNSRQAATPAKIKEAASQFEALLIAQMLQSSRGSGALGMGEGEDQNSTLVEMGEQQFAQSLASNGGLGIAKMVIAGLNQHAHR